MFGILAATPVQGECSNVYAGPSQIQLSHLTVGISAENGSVVSRQLTGSGRLVLRRGYRLGLPEVGIALDSFDRTDSSSWG